MEEGEGEEAGEGVGEKEQNKEFVVRKLE